MYIIKQIALTEEKVMFLRNAKKFKYRKLVVLVLLLLLVFSGFLMLVRNAGAENSPGWSWMEGDPVVSSSKDINDFPYDRCTGHFVLVKVDGYFDKKLVCRFSNGNVSFGYFTTNSGSVTVSIVGFAGNPMMYEIDTPCAYTISCSYLPGTDTLVVKNGVIGGHLSSLVLYKNFSERIRLNLTQSPLSKVRFEFNLDAPNYTLHNYDNQVIGVGGVGFSNNGKWIAFELNDGGVGRLDVVNLNVRRVSKLLFPYYGYGTDPATEFTVSNDGRSIVLMGSNSGLSLVDVDNSCGDGGGDFIDSSVPLDKSCRFVRFNVGAFINYFSYASHPKFSDDGGELTFSAESIYSVKKSVVLRANGYIAQNLNYLALGDSYTSGEGEFSDNYYLSGTNDPYEKCHLSGRSYPYLIAGSSLTSINPNLMKSVACSGAIVKDIYGGNDSYNGQQDRLLNFNYGQMTDSLQQTALQNFIPGRARQIDFVDRYHPEVITVGIGGNDVDFSGKVSACIIPATVCKNATDKTEKQKTALEIKNMHMKLRNLYSSIHNASPESKIYAVGYPRIIEPDGFCGKYIGKFLNSDERKYVDESVKYLNNVIQAAAKDAGVGYINIENSQGSHILCGGGDPTSMNFIKIGDDFNPIIDQEWAYALGQESFHPNPNGHAYTANYILNTIGDIASYNYCSNGSVVCPESTEPPEPSSYWEVDEFTNTIPGQFVEFISDSMACELQLSCKISLPSTTFLPNSEVQIVINSEPRVLGNFTTASDGSLNAEVSIPKDLGYGYHTMHIYGKSFTDESVDLYQGVKHFKPVEKNVGLIDTHSDQGVANVGLISAGESRVASVNNDDQDSGQDDITLANTSNVLGGGIFKNPAIITPSTLKNSDNLSVQNEEVGGFSGAILYYAFGFVVLGGLVLVFVRLMARK